jgi:hypothetical protein
VRFKKGGAISRFKEIFLDYLCLIATGKIKKTIYAVFFSPNPIDIPKLFLCPAGIKIIDDLQDFHGLIAVR